MVFFKFSFLKQKDKHQGKSCSAILFQFLFLFLFMSGFIPSTLADGCKHIFSERQKPKQLEPIDSQVGIEFEGLISNKVRWKKTIHSSIEHLNKFYSSKKYKGTKPEFDRKVIKNKGKLNPSIIGKKNFNDLDRPNVSIFFKKNEQYYIWQIKDDFSIKRDPNLNSIEIASPILRSEQDRQSFYSLLHRLKQEQGLVSEPTTGGLHIHVDYGESFHTKYLIDLVKLFLIMEHSFYDYFEISQERKTNFQKTSSNLIEFLKSPNDRYIYKTLIRFIEYFNTTVEFRLFNSTLDPKLIEFYVHFVTKLMKSITNQDPKLLAFIEENTSKKGIKQPFKIVEKFLTFINLNKETFNGNGDIQELFNILDLEAYEAL